MGDPEKRGDAVEVAPLIPHDESMERGVLLPFLVAAATGHADEERGQYRPRDASRTLRLVQTQAECFHVGEQSPDVGIHLSRSPNHTNSK